VLGRHRHAKLVPQYPHWLDVIFVFIGCPFFYCVSQLVSHFVGCSHFNCFFPRFFPDIFSCLYLLSRWIIFSCRIILPRRNRVFVSRYVISRRNRIFLPRSVVFSRFVKQRWSSPALVVKRAFKPPGQPLG
jgi:hypothetical protein